MYLLFVKLASQGLVGNKVRRRRKRLAPVCLETRLHVRVPLSHSQGIFDPQNLGFQEVLVMGSSSSGSFLTQYGTLHLCELGYT